MKKIQPSPVINCVPDFCGEQKAKKNKNTSEYKVPPHIQWSEQQGESVATICIEQPPKNLVFTSFHFQLVSVRAWRVFRIMQQRGNLVNET